jgi:hypothetical protein
MSELRDGGYVENHSNCAQMTDIFQQIRDQIHEIRNELAPVDFRLAHFEHEIAECRTVFEQKAMALESKIFAQSIKLEEQSSAILNILERLQAIELTLKRPPEPEPGKPLPVNGETQRFPNHASNP